MKTVLAWTTLFLVIVAARAAAEDVALAQRLLNEAHGLATAGDSRAALRKLDESYSAAPRVSTLFYKGTVYLDLLQAGRAGADDLRQAIACFERYAAGGSDAAKRELARTHLEEAKKALAGFKSAPPPTEKKPPPKPKTARSAPAEPPENDLRNPWAIRPPGAAQLPVAPATGGVEVSTISSLGALGIRADREAEFDKHVRRGVAMSRRGDRDGAVAEFVAAHDLIPRPELLRDAADESVLGCAGKKPAGDGAEEDVGGCYKRAAGFYRRYLESTGTPPDKPEVERKIRNADEKARIAKNDAKDTRRAQAAKKEERRGLYLKLAISSEVLAVVATATSITLFAVGKSVSDDLLAIVKDGQNTKQESKLGMVQLLYALGGGATVLSALLSAGGGVLFWNARPSPGNRLSIWIVPVGAGFMVGGRF